MPSLRSRAAVTTFVPGHLLQDCYLLDQSGTKIYVWKGRGATKAEKQMAMSKALVGAMDMQYYPKSLSTKRQRCSESRTRRWSTKHCSYIRDFKVRQTNWDSNPGLVLPPGVVVMVK